MRRNSILSIILLAFLACPMSAMALNEWTIIIYQCADDSSSSTLEDAAIRDLIELDTVGSQGGLEIIAQVDRGTKLSNLMKQVYSDPDYSGASRYLIKRDKWVGEGKIGEVDMGSPKTLWDCLKWAATDHPAKHYFLVLAGHGSGVFSWRGTGSVSSSTPGYVDFDPDNFVAYDDSSGDCLTVFEVNAVLSTFQQRYNRGRPIDMIAFDSCNAGCVEVMYQLRNTCKVAIASASTVPMCGLNYRSIASAIVRNNYIDPEELAEIAVKAFIDDAPCNGKGDIMGAFRLSQMENLAGSISRLSLELLRAMQQTGKGFGVNDLVSYNDNYWDIKRLCQSIVRGDLKLNGASNYGQVQECAQEVLTDRSAAVISLWYGGGYADQKAGGLSIAWPEAKDYKSYRNFYKALDFSQDTKWDEVLDRRELGI